MKPVRIGCCGWQYKDWRGRLYPEGLPQRRWLERYAEVFDTVEVNSTFSVSYTHLTLPTIYSV